MSETQIQGKQADFWQGFSMDFFPGQECMNGVKCTLTAGDPPVAGNTDGMCLSALRPLFEEILTKNMCKTWQNIQLCCDVFIFFHIFFHQFQESWTQISEIYSQFLLWMLSNLGEDAVNISGFMNAPMAMDASVVADGCYNTRLGPKSSDCSCFFFFF